MTSPWSSFLDRWSFIRGKDVKGMTSNIQPVTPLGNASAVSRKQVRKHSVAESVISKFQIEKVDGGFSVGGTSVAANCHIIIIVFAFCFLLIGMVLTAISYRPLDSDENSFQHTACIVFGGYTHVVGPILLVVGFFMFFFGCAWCLIVLKVKRDEREKERQRLSWSCSPELYSPVGTPDKKTKSLPATAIYRNINKRFSLPSLEGRFERTKKKMRFAVFPALDEMNSDGSADSGGKVSLVKDSHVTFADKSDERGNRSPTSYSLQSITFENETVTQPKKPTAFSRPDVTEDTVFAPTQESADVASFPNPTRFTSSPTCSPVLLTEERNKKTSRAPSQV